jgi:hypothetical protein
MVSHLIPHLPRPVGILRCLIAALFVVAASAARLNAQGTAPLSLTDLAYQDIDRLSELGVLDSVIIGQRPYSRREVGRIVRRARVRAQEGRWRDEPRVAAQIDVILDRLEQRFGTPGDTRGDTRGRNGPVLDLLDGARLSLTSTTSRRRGFPASYSRITEATIDPLGARRLGAPGIPGWTAAVELSQRFEPTGWLAFHARERAEGRAPRDTAVAHRAGELLLGAARARFNNVALTIGREQIAWSQRLGDGLFLASDAPALDQVSLASDHPFILPGFLRVFGPTQAMLIVADLGPSVVRSHSKLLAYKVSVAPTSALELGGTFMDHYGGAGGRASKRGNLLIDFLPMLDVFRKHNYYDTTHTMDVDTDKLLGVDGRLRLDRLGGLLVTGELLIDDFDIHRLLDLLTGYGSSQIAVTIPQLGTPTLALTLSAKHMGILTYTHGELTNGITTRGRLLGEELGPDAKAFGAELRWMPTPTLRLGIDARSAQYSNAEYGSHYARPDSTGFIVYKISHEPNELRERLRLSVQLRNERGMALVLRGGGERVRNADFRGGRRSDYAAEMAFEFQP